MTDTLAQGRPDTPAPLAHHPVRDILTGPVGSIGITLIIVVVAGLTLIGPRFLSASNITIAGQFVAIPMLIGAFASFALLAGVVDLSIGSMAGVSAAIFGALLVNGLGLWPGHGDHARRVPALRRRSTRSPSSASTPTRSRRRSACSPGSAARPMSSSRPSASRVRSSPSTRASSPSPT